MRKILIVCCLVVLASWSRAESPPLVVMEMNDGTVQKPASLTFINGRFEILTPEGERSAIEPSKVKSIRVNCSYVEMPVKLAETEKDVRRLATTVSDLQTSLTALKARLERAEQERADSERLIEQKTDQIRRQGALIANSEEKMRQAEERVKQAEQLAHESSRTLARMTRSPLDEPEHTPSTNLRIQIENPQDSVGQVKSVR